MQVRVKSEIIERVFLNNSTTCKGDTLEVYVEHHPEFGASVMFRRKNKQGEDIGFERVPVDYFAIKEV